MLDRYEATTFLRSPLAMLERARIAERLGDRATASRQYQFVADAWRNADPELQPHVIEAKSALSRLGGGPGR